MPTQSNEVGRDLERRASDGLNPEKRTETAGHPATRRKVLSMVTGGIAATAAVGTATASKRPTVTATSPECGVLHLQYTDRGPTVQVNIDGPQSESVTLGKSKRSESFDDVAPGDYFVEARPVNANGGSSVPVEGTPVPVDECGEVTATFTGCAADMAFGVDIVNERASCVHLEIVTKRGGSDVITESIALGPGDDESSTKYFSGGDEWIFGAYSPPASGDCVEKGEDIVPINGVASPIRLTGHDCSSLTVEEGSLEGV